MLGRSLSFRVSERDNRILQVLVNDGSFLTRSDLIRHAIRSMYERICDERNGRSNETEVQEGHSV